MKNDAHITIWARALNALPQGLCAVLPRHPELVVPGSSSRLNLKMQILESDIGLKACIKSFFPCI